ncbi:hypothetical protein HXY33_01005 [Candidatus Bathyarchaeota archaeon]|nr:hypothetical protein [Candidatus Bathyarchaeota archaeon]
MERTSHHKIGEEKNLTETKKAIIIFHYTEKIKSNLILTFSLLEVLSTMRDEEIEGAEKLLTAFLNALIREVHIAANATEVKGFKDVNAKLEETIEQVKQHNYAEGMKLVSEAISLATTGGSQAVEVLKEKNLI